MADDPLEVTERPVGDDRRVRVVRGDITAIEVDAVVNAANEQLRHGGGVAAALARAGGPQVQRDSDAWVDEHGPLRPGRSAVTTAGHMPAASIIHVVGPRYAPDQDNAGLLAQAVSAALDAGAAIGATSLALPAISAGIFGYPPPQATAVVADTCLAWLADTSSSVVDVALVGYDDETAQLFSDAVSQTSPR